MLKKILVIIVMVTFAFAGKALAVQPANHGAAVSELAKATELGPGHGAIVSALAKNNGQRDCSLKFDGVDDYVLVPNSDSLKSSSLTVECWVKVHTPPSEMPGVGAVIVQKANTNNHNIGGDFIIALLEEGTPRWHPFNRGGNPTWEVLDSNYVLPANEWHHLAGTFDGISNKIYIDGTLNNLYSYEIPQIPTRTDYPIMIGGGTNNAGDAFFKGCIDDLKIWNRALTQEEIKAGMFNKVANLPGLVSIWNFDEGSGSIAHDSTANHNDGTLYGAEWSIDFAPGK